MILTMGETSLVVAMVMGQVLKKEKSKGLFKAVLRQHHVLMGPLAKVTHHNNSNSNNGYSDSVEVAPTEAMISHKDSKRRHRDVVKSASAEISRQILVWFVTLPLNFLPVAGPASFCYINGKARMPDVHRRYFDLKDMTVKEREAWIQARSGQYLMFSVVAQALELAPVVGIVFGFTNIIGAALWAVDLERRQDALRDKKLLQAIN
ncbi:hypothetical protein BG011_007646 [Mortierella polycephala]|uniref:Uncharacterized protein n=1 Tax=Mortierella polycephala TaxID=41804 RepID=A0A9P6QIZ3_9FUNG|nr:hypothetical protein BG011_007646 [Mortierella polycephala]